MYSLFFKRFFDLIFSLILITISSPILLLTILGLYFINNGNVFFYQLRPGKNEVIFRIWKFKTMNDAKDENGILLPDNLRITSFGSIIRKLSIDELPQLFNVIKGEMSLIGPRPLLIEYLPLYNEFQKRRHLLRPGITGWAQVNGRNSIIWQQKFEYDIWYVENMSFTVDLKILFLTVKKVFVSDGINQGIDQTMEKFKGTN